VTVAGDEIRVYRRDNVVVIRSRRVARLIHLNAGPEVARYRLDAALRRAGMRGIALRERLVEQALAGEVIA